MKDNKINGDDHTSDDEIKPVKQVELKATILNLNVQAYPVFSSHSHEPKFIQVKLHL
jgi:hypothetical protein